jgi:F0F1-type ATP synthase membrane subunit b/b'
VAFPYDYIPPAKYAGHSDDELIDILAQLTQDLVNMRSDLSRISSNWNSRFYKTFMEAHRESVAARNRLAENDTTQLTNEKVECEANIAATVDLCALVRIILKHRRNYG